MHFKCFYRVLIPSFVLIIIHVITHEMLQMRVVFFEFATIT